MSVRSPPFSTLARAAQAAGEYPAATRKGREAAEMARWAIERLYTGTVSELRQLLETARGAGLTEELARPGQELEEAETALQTREWKRAREILDEARGLTTTALVARIDGRTAEIEALYRGVPPAGRNPPAGAGPCARARGPGPERLRRGPRGPPRRGDADPRTPAGRAPAPGHGPQGATVDRREARDRHHAGDGGLQRGAARAPVRPGPTCRPSSSAARGCSARWSRRG